jgi:hypothetical protein
VTEPRHVDEELLDLVEPEAGLRRDVEGGGDDQVNDV